MARRLARPLYGVKYCANTASGKKQVHDLDNEKTQCQIDEIVASGQAKPYNYLADAYNAGYDNCRWCLAGQAELINTDCTDSFDQLRTGNTE